MISQSLASTLPSRDTGAPCGNGTSFTNIAKQSLLPLAVSIVPASALLFRASGPQVAVIGGNGTVKFQDVTIARDNGNFVEIASGLSAGDTVALNISNQIANGDHVLVREDAKTAAR